MNAKLMTALIAGGLLLGSSAFAKDYTVKMLNTGADGTFVFEPGYLHVQKGDTVTFKATDAGHDSKSVFVPAGAKNWSGEISKDVKVSFSTDGVYIYECAPHHLFGMFGVIQVGKATNKAAAQKKAAELEAKLMMNKGRINKLVGEAK